MKYKIQKIKKCANCFNTDAINTIYEAPLFTDINEAYRYVARSNKEYKDNGCLECAQSVMCVEY